MQESTYPTHQWTAQSSKSVTHDLERLAKQNHDSFTATLCATLSTLRQESNARFTRVEAKIEGHTNTLEAMQTRINALERNDGSSSSGSHQGKAQNSVRAVATGFTESSTAEEVRQFFPLVIKEHVMEESLEDTQCPANPNTHSFLPLKTEKDRREFLRLTSRQQYAIEQRTVPDLNPEERYLQTQLGFAKNYPNTTCEIPLNRMRINREQKHISAQGVIVITTRSDGTLKFHSPEAIREQIVERMDQRTRKKQKRKKL